MAFHIRWMLTFVQIFWKSTTLSSNLIVLTNKRSFAVACRLNISFTIENEENKRMSFLDVNIIREKGKFTTTVYRTPIYSDWTEYYLKLVKLIDVSKSNDYRENFINNFFKVFLDNRYRIQQKVMKLYLRKLCF